MRTLSATEILDVWEWGERQHPLDRALTLIATTCPEKNREELVYLSIGQRDALLLTLRQLTLGPQMEAYAECPACSTQLEFTIDIEELLRGYREASAPEYSIEVDDFTIRFRLPDSIDLANCINSGSTVDTELLKQCVLTVNRGDEKTTVENLTEIARTELMAQMAALDPLSEIEIALNCTGCGHLFRMPMDILSFFWSELKEQVKQLLNQVHALARYYGWREVDILSMSPWRRQYYLEMVT